MFTDILSVRVARTAQEVEQALHVRWLGYRKYESCARPVLEDLDRGKNCSLLLATDGQGNAVGTIRILDRSVGPIELERFLDVDALLPGSNRSVAEATRLSVPHSPVASRVKLLLWKAYYLLCLRRKTEYMLVSMRPGAARAYEGLLFSKAAGGAYSHADLGGLPHETYSLHVPSARERFASRSHPLYEFFIDAATPEISLEA